MNNNNYLYSLFIGTGVILLTEILMKLNLVSTEFSGILLGITVGWFGATGFLRYLNHLDERRSLASKSKQILNELKDTIKKK